MFDEARRVEHLRLPLATDFIERCAQHIADAGRARFPDLSPFLVVLPGMTLAPALRRALGAAAGCTLLLPRMTTLAQLAAAQPGGQPDSLRQLALYRQLRDHGWFDNGALWEVCAELIALFDELHAEAIDLPGDEAAFIARVEAAYRARGSQPLRFEAEVVHRLWRAEVGGAPGRQAAAALALARRAEGAQAPLFVLCDGEPRRIESAFCAAWAARQPATLLQPVRTLDPSPTMRLLNGAWPPTESEAPPLVLRAEALRAGLPQSPLAGRLRLIRAANLEEEAQQVAAEVRRWLAGGRRHIALVAADRVTARRARALLERDGILVQDETGWKLSTTRAAALVDAWLEVVAADAYHLDLLDLLKSPFILGDLPEETRQAGLQQLERGLARHNLSCGLGRIATVLGRDADCAGARVLLERIAAAQRHMPRGSATPAQWLSGLDQALGGLGALAALADDAAGEGMLGLLRQRGEELGAVSWRLTFVEWREWLNRELEAAAFVDRGIESSLVMTHLAAMRLRRFEAAILVGADRDNLAPDIPRAVFGNQAVRAELGLPGAAAARARLRDDLAGLVAACDEVAVTWQHMREDEINLPSPEVELLSLLHRQAWGDDLVAKGATAQPAPAAAGGTPQPAPRAGQCVPLKLSPSAYASLLACPYQFFARRVLRLEEADTVREALEKRDYGEYVHRALQRFHAAFPQLSGLPEAELAAQLEAVSGDVFAPAIEANFLEHAWLSRWLERVPGYIEWQKGREAQGWRHAGAEQSRDIALPLAGGGELRLAGRLDRLDRRADGSEAVLDYKTQDASKLRKRMEDAGEDVQLACYALLQGAQVGEAAYVSLDADPPAEVALPEVQAMARAQAGRLAALVEALRDGAALPANGIDAVCDWCEMRGLCRRDYHSPPPSPRPEGGDNDPPSGPRHNGGGDGCSPPAGGSAL
jgi:ATP-dependent helicase/nuclease subunit B